jgi:DNA end-binding protein Ku
MKPVGYKRVNKATGHEVDKDDIVKGIEVADGRYVVLSDAEIKAALPQTTQTVEILAFIDAGRIAPAFFERPYVLVPVARGEKVYVLLREALRKSGRIGIARVVIQAKQHLAALFPDGDALRLNTLRWADELRELDDLDLPGHGKKNAPAARELQMAERLIEDMSADWEPGRYEDHFKEEILALVNRKRGEGEVREVETVEGPPQEGGAKIIDLADLLRRSLEGRKTAPARGRAKAAAARKKASGAARRRAG